MSIISDPVSFNFKFHDLKISEKNLINSLGYEQGEILPEPVYNSIKDAFSKVQDLCDIRGGYVISEDVIVERENKRIQSHSLWFNTGQIVTHQLRRSEKAAWFICTAGESLTKHSREQNAGGDTLSAYVIDVISNIIVEKAMDLIQAKLKSEMDKQGFKITNRYSPGYCDWSINEQKKLFQAFPKKYLDISLTKSCLMIPIKSVSGVIGIGSEVTFNDYTCNLCADTDCYYRNKKTE